MRGSFVLLMLVLCAAVQGRPARAHPLAPSLLDVREESPGRAVASWKRPLGAPDAALEPLLPATCTAAGSATLRSDDSARILEIPLACPDGLVGARIGVTGFAGASANVLLRVALHDGRVVHRVLRPGDPTYVVPARPNALATAWSYLGLGLGHIAGGFDHLLFLLGLFILAVDRRQLLGMVTAFTAGHGVTLSLAALGHVALPSAPVEVGIALTIVLLAVELTQDPAGEATLLRRRPGTLTFGFGLLHGLGFAGALREAGLPDREVLPALLGFNGGIEVGQIAFVLGVAVLARAAAPVTGHWRSGRTALAYTIGSVAACLVLERAGLLLG